MEIASNNKAKRRSQGIAFGIFRALSLCIVLILFACFQVFAPNSYSLPLLCTIIVLWNVYRLYYWQNQPKNLSEINREFVDEFKTGLNNVKKNLQRKE